MAPSRAHLCSPRVDFCFQDRSNMVPNLLQDGPRKAQDCNKTAEHGPRMAQDCPKIEQTCSRQPENSPRRWPKSPQADIKTKTNELGAVPGTPGGCQDKGKENQEGFQRPRGVPPNSSRPRPSWVSFPPFWSSPAAPGTGPS